MLKLCLNGLRNFLQIINFGLPILYRLGLAIVSISKPRGAAVVGNGFVHLGARELVQLPRSGEDEERDLGVAQHGQLECLLQKPTEALGEGDLPARRVLNPLQLHARSLRARGSGGNRAGGRLGTNSGFAWLPDDPEVEIERSKCP